MYETGIYDLSQLHDSKFYSSSYHTKNKKFSVGRTQKSLFKLNQFKSWKQNKFNINCINLRLEHFELAYEFWLIGICISFVCLISEIFMLFFINFTFNNTR